MLYTEKQQKTFYDETKKYLAAKDASKLKASDISKLEDLVRFHEYRYYVLNDPLVSDFEYDVLYKLLEALEKKFPESASPNSPTKRVSSDLTDDFTTVRHLTPMLSLDNSYDENDLIKFDTQVKKLTDLKDIIYSVEPKYDGGSIAVVYENDKLVRTATRGNGVEGEEITIQSRTIKSLPLEAEFSKKGIYRAEVRGEAVISKERFKKINANRLDEGLTLLANPRNSAAGDCEPRIPQKLQDERSMHLFISWDRPLIKTEGICSFP